MKDLSINAGIFIIILLFVYIGFVVKMFNKYYGMKESGYLREKTFQEQLEQRVMKSFGNSEELNALIRDFMQYKKTAETITNSLKEQSKQLKLTNKKLEDSMKMFEDEKGLLQRGIWALEDSLSQAKDIIREKDLEIHELTERLETVTVKEALLKKQLEEQSKVPSKWYIPAQ